MNLLMPLFAYGTLRPGQPLEGWLSDATAYHEPATVQNYALLLPDHGWYPYMVERSGEQVRGDVLWISDPDALARTIVMEVSAGYDLTSVPAMTAAGDLVHAYAFRWLTPDPSWRAIPGGDWTSRESDIPGVMKL